MVVVLLASQKSRCSCCPIGILKSRHGCCSVGILKSLGMVAVMLEFFSNMAHALLASSSFIKMGTEASEITKNIYVRTGS